MVDFEYRLAMIHELAAGLETKKTDLQEAGAVDAGFPIKVTGLEVDLAINHLRSMSEEVPWVGDRKPFGTVAAIFPYDAPAVMLARLGGAALLTGNRLRLSFSSQTPHSARILAQICKAIPSFEPLLDTDNRDFGSSCVADEEVRVLFISGGFAVGQVYRKNHEHFDKLFFAGPGGMPAAVVFPDADIDQAARFIARRAFINGGQYCTTLKKAFIHKDIYQTLKSRILESLEELRVGDPFDPQTDIGPITVERTRVIVKKALKDCSDAQVLSGKIENRYIYPFVLEMPESIPVPDMETFGPLLVLKPFSNADDAVNEAVRTRYGFLLAFFGSPSTHHKALFRDNFGMVYDNPDFLMTPLRLPFGGKKESGWILERVGSEWTHREGAFLYSKELCRTSGTYLA